MKLKSKKVISEELRDQVRQKLEGAEDKSAAIVEAVDEIVSSYNAELIDLIVEEAARAQGDAEYKASLGLRALSQKEKDFYAAIKAGPDVFKQSVTASQVDILPVETIDHTLDDIKKASGITKLINFSPANVKHWLTGSKTGAAAWGTLTDAITAEINATISGLNIEVSKLYAYCVIPKAIRDLEIGFVDRYFTAVLREAMEDGIAAGYLNGNGKTAPTGIFKQIDAANTNGTAKDKAVTTTVTGFSPAQLAPVLKSLSKNGQRRVEKLYIVCNPLDEYQYVNPAMYGDSLTGGYVNKSFMPMEVVSDANCQQGKAAFTLEGVYTMGFSGLKVDEYKETKALDDADVIIAKVYGNGRADDDSAAYVFDVTKLEEYVPKVINLASAAVDENAGD